MYALFVPYTLSSRLNIYTMSSKHPAPTISFKKGKRKAPPTAEASAYNVQLSALETPGYTHVQGLKQETANKASELLMLNHAKYHTLFNEVGLHSELYSILIFVQRY